MSKNVSILLVGIGGYGKTYVNALLDNWDDNRFTISGAVDPYSEACKRLHEIKEKNIPVYATMEQFYEKHMADLVVISSPIQFHCEQVCLALSKGSNVLCEKPLSATVDEAYKMIKARDEAGKFVAIGYQWSFSKAIQDLKKDIIDGVYGAPKRFKTVVLWPRALAYFKRGWAARIKDDKGNWILDSVANNATAHYLHNMFYVLGDKTDGSVRPASVVSEIYRANNIENYDTAAMRIITENGVELLYLASHAVDKRIGPIFDYEFENASIRFADTNKDNNIIAYFNDGRQKDYGNPFENAHRKLWTSIDAVSGKSTIPCGIEAALSHTICINAIQREQSEIINFPAEQIKLLSKEEPDESIIYMEGLYEVMQSCYDNWLLPNEMGVAWSKEVKKSIIGR